MKDICNIYVPILLPLISLHLNWWYNHQNWQPSGTARCWCLADTSFPSPRRSNTYLSQYFVLVLMPKTCCIAFLLIGVCFAVGQRGGCLYQSVFDSACYWNSLLLVFFLFLFHQHHCRRASAHHYHAVLMSLPGWQTWCGDCGGNVSNTN